MLFDTHCHLDAHNFPEGHGDVLVRARSAGVGRFACVGVGSLESAKGAIALAKSEPDVVATVGVHPHDAASIDDHLFEQMSALGREPEVVAIGEVGLDYHYDHSPRDTQRQVFRRFVALARELEKPLVIHTRSAAADTLAVLEEERARDVGGIIHCFSEDRAFAERALALGFDLSFSGIVTFKSAKAIQEVAAWAPADRIMVETDSPYLAPVPLRGKRCEPAFVVHTARFVAALRGLEFDEFSALTTANAERRFGLAAASHQRHPREA